MLAYFLFLKGFSSRGAREGPPGDKVLPGFEPEMTTFLSKVTLFTCGFGNL